MNWHERIARAEREGGFTPEDVELAASWVFCACGEQDPLIPRTLTGSPIDPTLKRLGRLFMGYVASDSIDSATATLNVIDSRAEKILKDMAA